MSVTTPWDEGVPTTDLYFEAHITIDPVDDDDEQIRELAARYGFRIAELLMKKTRDPHRLDSFMTTRGTDYADIHNRTTMLVMVLQSLDYTVRRYKIENTILDVRP